MHALVKDLNRVSSPWGLRSVLHGSYRYSTELQLPVSNWTHALEHGLHNLHQVYNSFTNQTYTIYMYLVYNSFIRFTTVVSDLQQLYLIYTIWSGLQQFYQSDYNYTIFRWFTTSSSGLDHLVNIIWIRLTTFHLIYNVCFRVFIIQQKLLSRVQFKKWSLHRHTECLRKSFRY
jgi:hypothetical protein